MEPEVKEFLKRVLSSIFAGLLWLLLNSTFGIMFGFAFPQDRWTVGNYIFFIWFLASFCLLIWFYVRLWKKPLEEKDEN